MALPYYVSPEQIMQDKAEYSKKGIAKGKSIIALGYDDGVVLAAENPSSSLNKISEIYDQIAFAGAGKYSEFENLRKAGIRHADLKGYLYSREDVTAKSLANAYSQSLGTIFSQEIKPLEIEILVVEVGKIREDDQLYRISFDGSIYEEKEFAVIGGKSEDIITFLRDRYKGNMSVEESLKLSVSALENSNNHKITPDNLEVAVLDRRVEGRRFKKITHEEIKEIIEESGVES
ncbi:MAG: proteasome subunit alpha [Nitrospirota bacterium]